MESEAQSCPPHSGAYTIRLSNGKELIANFDDSNGHWYNLNLEKIGVMQHLSFEGEDVVLVEWKKA